MIWRNSTVSSRQPGVRSRGLIVTKLIAMALNLMVFLQTQFDFVSDAVVTLAQALQTTERREAPLVEELHPILTVLAYVQL